MEHLHLCLTSTEQSILLIAVCTRVNSSSSPQSIPGNRITVCNIDTKFHDGRSKLVLEVKLVSLTQCYACSQTVFHIVSIWEFWSYPCAQRDQATRDTANAAWDIVTECQLF